MALLSTGLVILIMSTFLPLLTPQQCPYAQYFDINSALQNQLPFNSCSPFSLQSNYSLYVYASGNFLVLSTPNQTDSFIWYNASLLDLYVDYWFEVDTNNTYNLSNHSMIDTNELIQGGRVTFFPASYYFLEFSTLSSFVLISLALDPTAQINFTSSGTAPTITNLSLICVDMTQHCLPCPDTCPYCFGSNYNTSCLSPCNPATSYDFNNYTCIPLPISNSSSNNNTNNASVPLDNNSSDSTNNNVLFPLSFAGVVTSSFVSLSPTLNMISISAFQFNNPTSFILLLGLTDTLLNLQYFNTSLSSLLHQILNDTPVYIQYLSIAFWISQIPSSVSKYALFATYQIPTIFVINVVLPALSDLSIILITKVIVSLQVCHRKPTRPHSSPFDSRTLLPTLLAYALAKSQNSLLYFLLKLQSYLFGDQQTRSKFSLLDYLDVISCFLTAIWIIYAFLLLSQSALRDSKSLNQAIFIVYQLIYISFIFFGQALPPITQSVTLLTLISLWILSFLWTNSRHYSGQLWKSILTLEKDQSTYNLSFFQLFLILLFAISQCLDFSAHLQILILLILLLSNQIAILTTLILIPRVYSCLKHKYQVL